MSTVAADADLARSIVSLYGLITWVAIGITLVVFVSLAWVLVRFRERPGAPLPRQIHGHTLLELSWTIAPALVLLVIAIPTIQVVFRTQGETPRGALEVTVRGWQWWWEFRYPSLDVVTANELYLPVGQPVVLHLEGPDVIHSFWVPQLAGKLDMVPGRLQHLQLTADRPGTYRGQCAEFCGEQHANMALHVVALPPAEFDAWLAAQALPAVATPEQEAGRQAFLAQRCDACHAVRGVTGDSRLGPDLTHVGSRLQLAAGTLPNTEAGRRQWIAHVQKLKSGARMPSYDRLGDETIGAIAQWLGALR